jgi:hypothetical protein
VAIAILVIVGKPRKTRALERNAVVAHVSLRLTRVDGRRRSRKVQLGRLDHPRGRCQWHGRCTGSDAVGYQPILTNKGAADVEHRGRRARPRWHDTRSAIHRSDTTDRPPDLVKFVEKPARRAWTDDAARSQAEENNQGKPDLVVVESADPGGGAHFGWSAPLSIPSAPYRLPGR